MYHLMELTHIIQSLKKDYFHLQKLLWQPLSIPVNKTAVEISRFSILNDMLAVELPQHVLGCFSWRIENYYVAIVYKKQWYASVVEDIKCSSKDVSVTIISLKGYQWLFVSVFHVWWLLLGSDSSCSLSYWMTSHFKWAQLYRRKRPCLKYQNHLKGLIEQFMLIDAVIWSACYFVLKEIA